MIVNQEAYLAGNLRSIVNHVNHAVDKLYVILLYRCKNVSYASERMCGPNMHFINTLNTTHSVLLAEGYKHICTNI